MKKTKTASDILLAGVPEINETLSTSRTRRKYINDIERVNNEIGSIVYMVSGISKLISPEVRKTNDSILGAYIEILVSEGNEIQRDLNTLSSDIVKLSNIENDEQFLVSSFTVLDTASNVLAKTQGKFMNTYNDAIERIKVLNKEVETKK